MNKIEQTDRQTDRIDKQRQTDRMDRQTGCTDRWMHRQTNRCADKQTDVQTNRQMCRQTDRCNNKHMDAQTENVIVHIMHCFCKDDNKDSNWYFQKNN